MRFTTKRAMLGVFAAATLFCAASAFGAECDNFTGRGTEIRDSIRMVDLFTNLRLARAEQIANAAGGCQRSKLFAAVKSKLGWSPVGQLEWYVSFSKTLERLPQNPFKSIYHDGPNALGITINRIGAAVPSIKLAGHIVGADKLGHFMAQGYDYYRLVTEGGKNLKDAMKWGIATEESYFGLWPSGVKSYADLAANAAGYRFWSNVLDGENPYFVCESEKFIQVRQFTWADYVSDAWDEAINCSEHVPSVDAIYTRNLAKLGMTCPVAGSTEICGELSKRPGANFWLSPRCRVLAPWSVASPAFDLVP